MKQNPPILDYHNCTWKGRGLQQVLSTQGMGPLSWVRTDLYPADHYLLNPPPSISSPLVDPLFGPAHGSGTIDLRTLRTK